MTKLVRGADLTWVVPDDYVTATPIHRRLDPRYEYHIVEQAIRTPGASGPLMGVDASVGSFTPTYLAGSAGPGGGDFGPCVSMATGASAAGRVHWGLGNGTIGHNFNSFYEFIYWRSLIALSDLSDAVEEFDIWGGFGDSVVGSTPTDGAQFVYNRDGLGVNWFVQNRGGGSGAAVDTGVPVTVGAVELIVSTVPSTGFVKYWINGTVVAALSNNYPTSAQTFGAGIGIAKSLGTTSRSFLVAYQEVYARWGTPRGLALPAELT